jgi:hypothetical protein
MSEVTGVAWAKCGRYFDRACHPPIDGATAATPPSAGVIVAQYNEAPFLLDNYFSTQNNNIKLHTKN